MFSDHQPRTLSGRISGRQMLLAAINQALPCMLQRSKLTSIPLKRQISAGAFWGADNNKIEGPRMNRVSKWTMPLGLATVLGLAVFAIQSAQAAPFTTLYSFCSQTNCADGSGPDGLIQGTDGNIYGTTDRGGAAGLNSGTVFKITLSGSLTTLYSFCSEDCVDGQTPTGLIQATDGTFYGTTVNGGDHGLANGTVFQITAGGTFTSQGMYEATRSPDRPPIQGSDGNFYGNSGDGGQLGEGAVYKLTPAGKVSTLYTFCVQADCPDGSLPGGLIQGTDGNFYGTTAEGGANTSSCDVACGTVFKLTSGGDLTTLYSFCAQSGCADGVFPLEALVQASYGNFYGTTSEGGVNATSCDNGCGTVFKITPAGTFTTLYSFCSQINCTDGSEPGLLIQATDGNLYGGTAGGGNVGGNCPSEYGCGTIFKITRDGKLTTLHRFCSKKGCPDGSGAGELVQYTDGTFYGVTAGGGTNSEGTIFSLSDGLGAFVKTQTASGTVGAAVAILGTDLTSATGVTFNGTTAAFSIVSASEITTTVPTGATTGFVEVTTSGGTLKSNTKFKVTP
jgi:uncharacterized repeat protein (TIGR03803 family)